MPGELRKVGRFEIERVLGKGAMGLVYLAFDPRIGRRVALKTIRGQEGMTDRDREETRARFLREAQAAGRLVHPNIVTIFDIYEEEEAMYIAMEYVEGISLDNFCEKLSLLPIEKVISITKQGLNALDFAHKSRIIHRDVKPANMMLIDGELVKIMDFGLAKDVGANLTQTGTIIGTPHYMSPEQIQGKLLDGRSDLFSMGIVLYELLTGERPFSGNSISTIIYKILNESPVEIKSINKNIPAGLNAIVLKSLAKNPDKRFQSGHEFVSILNNYKNENVISEINSDNPNTTPIPRFSSSDVVLPAPEILSSAKKKVFTQMGLKLGVMVLFIILFCLSIYIVYNKLQKGNQDTINSPASREKEKAIPIHTYPEGALLYLDGKRIDSLRLSESDKEPHKLEARLGCYYGMMELKSKRHQKPITINLEKGHGMLEVESTPPGAKVFADDKDTGMITPASVPLKDCSSLAISLKKEGFSTVTRNIDPEKEFALEITMTQVKEMGALQVKCISGIVDIYEGSKHIGKSSSAISLEPGEHEITIRLQSLRALLKRNVTIKTQETSYVDIGSIQTGSVYLYGPGDGRVIVDGEPWDELPVTGKPLSTGVHQINVMLSGGKKVSFPMKIEPGNNKKVVE